jgi:ankyrin repeat protein
VTRKRPKRHDRPGVDRYGRTDLHYAAGDGDLARVRALLAAAADPGLPDDDGWTPLHFAAQAHAAAVCEALLAAGAPVDPVDSHGNTPLWRATFESRGRGDVIALLRRHGADARRPNAHGVSPANLARTIANFDVTQYFTDVVG